MVESTIARYPDPASLGGWGYTRGLFLLGAYRVYQRVGEPSYLAYIKRWVDNFVDADGHMSRTFDNLDAMQSGNLLLILHRETGDARYRTAADQIRTRFTSYPRTTDGGMWHATGKTNELWADGVFMSQPFLLRYGIAYGDKATRTTRSPGTSRCTSATSRHRTGCSTTPTTRTATPPGTRTTPPAPPPTSGPAPSAGPR